MFQRQARFLASGMRADGLHFLSRHKSILNDGLLIRLLATECGVGAACCTAVGLLLRVWHSLNVQNKFEVLVSKFRQARMLDI